MKLCHGGVRPVSVFVEGRPGFDVLPQVVRSPVEIVVDLRQALERPRHVLPEGRGPGCEEDENLEALKADGG